MVYITGDTHRQFDRIELLCRKNNTTTDDVLIILGDAGINYFEDFRDNMVKAALAMLPITLFCVHGNHEARPKEKDGYIKKQFMLGNVLYQPEYPNILFPVDGELFLINGNLCCVCGGAYSVDKQLRLNRGMHWFNDEQPDEETKRTVENSLSRVGWCIDCMLTHTCPELYIPRECLISGVDQRTVDHTTERWLDHIEENLAYSRWYCGHFHTNKRIDKMVFMYEDIIEFTGV